MTEHFDIQEFACNNGEPVPPKFEDNVKNLAEELEIIRYILSARAKKECPVHITSGFRTPEYNKEVGGAEHSQHLTASAADIYIDEYKTYNVAGIIEELINANILKQGGIGKYEDFTHYDIRGTAARW